MPVTRGISDRHYPRRLFCLGGGLLVVGILGCSQAQTPASTAQVLHRGLSGEPATLDPAAAADTFSSEVMEDLYEGLTTESPSGAVIPGVAASWTVNPSGTSTRFSCAQTLSGRMATPFALRTLSPPGSARSIRNKARRWRTICG